MNFRYFLALIISLIASGIVILNNTSQKIPNDNQIKKLFVPRSGRELIHYEVVNMAPYATFLDKENARECKVNLIKDYKFGFFTGAWIFGKSWSCSK